MKHRRCLFSSGEAGLSSEEKTGVHFLDESREGTSRRGDGWRKMIERLAARNERRSLKRPS